MNVRNTLDFANYYIVPSSYEYFEGFDVYRYSTSYGVARTILRFYVTGIPAPIKITAAYITMYCMQGEGQSGCLQRVPVPSLGAVSDYLAFAGPSFGSKIISLGINKFSLNSSAITYLSDPTAVYFNFMLREYAHDYQNKTPPDQQYLASTFYTHNTPVTQRRPILNISYYA
jgi:hypothetical protein